MNPKKTNAREKNFLWPENELPCIWMDAGVIDYKLCDRNFDCENCPFDAIIRNGDALSDKKVENPFSTCSLNSSKTLASPQERPTLLEDILHIPQVSIENNNFYGCSFWYVVPTSQHTAILGLNRLAVKLLPGIKDVIVPPSKSNIERGKTLCWFVLDEGTVCLPSPLSGKIAQTNDDAVEQCGDKSDPDNVWIVKIHADNLEADLNALLRADDADAFLHVQRAKTLDMLSMYVDNVHSDLGKTLQDGGTFIGSPEDLLGPKRYFEFILNIFGCRFAPPKRQF
jgi:glycine cleavage system H lipoate-binding protein